MAAPLTLWGGGCTVGTHGDAPFCREGTGVLGIPLSARAGSTPSGAAGAGGSAAADGRAGHVRWGRLAPRRAAARRRLVVPRSAGQGHWRGGKAGDSNRGRGAVIPAGGARKPVSRRVAGGEGRGRAADAARQRRQSPRCARRRRGVVRRTRVLIFHGKRALLSKIHVFKIPTQSESPSASLDNQLGDTASAAGGGYRRARARRCQLSSAVLATAQLPLPSIIMWSKWSNSLLQAGAYSPYLLDPPTRRAGLAGGVCTLATGAL